MKQCITIPKITVGNQTIDLSNRFETEEEAIAFIKSQPALRAAVKQRTLVERQLLSNMSADFSEGTDVSMPFYVNDAEAREDFARRKDTEPIFNLTTDRVQFKGNEGYYISTPNADNLVAPTEKIHMEGQEFVNNPKYFKPGIPIFYIKSNFTPWNQKGFVEKNWLELGRMSSVVFIDKNNVPISVKTIQDAKASLGAKIKSGEWQIKYVGSFYDYNSTKYDKILNSNVKRKTAIQIAMNRAAEYKRRLLNQPSIDIGKDNIHIDFDLYEVLKETIGFNSNIDLIEDENGLYREDLKNIKDLTYIEGTPMIGVLMGRQEEMLDKPKAVVTPGFNANKQLDWWDEIFADHQNWVPGDVILWVPTSIRRSIDEGTRYKPTRLMVRAYYNEKHQDLAFQVLQSRVHKILNKVLNGTISYTIETNNRGEAIITKFTDSSIIKFKDFNERVEIQALLIEKYKKSSLYDEYKNQTEEPTENGFIEFIEIKNPIIEGLNKYPSLYQHKLIHAPEYLSQMLGFEKVFTDGLTDLLILWQSYKDKALPLDEAITEFKKAWGGKRLQVNVNELTNPIYWDNYLFKYNILRTGLNKDRPTHSISFYTAPKEKTNEPNVVYESEVEKRLKIRQSTTEDQGPLIPIEQVKEWVDKSFPRVNVVFKKILIEAVSKGEYDGLSKEIAIAEKLESNGYDLKQIKEEIGHAIFDKLDKKEKDLLLKQAQQETGSDSIIDQEEYIMQQIRKSPDQIKYKSAIARFLETVVNYFKELFKNKNYIQDFVNKFTNGYYSNFENQKETKTEQEALSPIVVNNSESFIKSYVNLVNRKYVKDIIKETPFIDYFETTAKMIGGTINGSFKFIYDTTIPNNIKDRQNEIINELKAFGLKINEPISIRAINEQAKIAKAPNSIFKLILEYIDGDDTLRLLKEPLFKVELYKDLKQTYGIKVTGTIEDIEKDTLGVVKAKDIKIIEQVSPALKNLITFIPAVEDINEDEFKVLSTKLSIEDGDIAVATPIENIPGVTYVKDPNTFHYLYEGNMLTKVNYLAKHLSNSFTSDELVKKLNWLKDNGEDWARVFAFKVLEDRSIYGEGDSTLLKDVWQVGQLVWVPYIHTYTTASSQKTGTLNQGSIKKRLFSKFVNSAWQFGFKGNEFYSKKEEKDLYKKLDNKLRVLENTTNKSKFVKEALAAFELFSIPVTKDELNSVMMGYYNKGRFINKRGAQKAIKEILNTLFYHSYKYVSKDELRIQSSFDLPIPGTYTNELGEEKYKSQVHGALNDLATIFSDAVGAKNAHSFFDMEGNMRQSYSKPNVIFFHFMRLFTNETYLKKFKQNVGISYNPLVTQFTTMPKMFELAVYQGDKTAKANYENMVERQRYIAELNMAVQYNYSDKAKIPKGYFSLGNMGDSPINYVLNAPRLSKASVINGMYALLEAEVDVLTSGIEAHDERFAENLKKNSLYRFPELNDIVIKNLKLGVDNREVIKQNIYDNTAEIKEILTKKLDEEFAMYRKKLSKLGIGTADNKNIEEKNHEELHPYFFSTVNNELRISKLEEAFLNIYYYQVSFADLMTTHPYFFKDDFDYSKRIKLFHTSGDVPYDSLNPNDDRQELKYIILKDRETSNPKLLEFIENNAYNFVKDVAIKGFSKSKGTDSGAYMSMAMLEKRNREGKGWGPYDERYKKAQQELDYDAIKQYESLVEWSPLKLGSVSMRIVNLPNGLTASVPTIQKYAFQILLPSDAYGTLDDKLIHPDKQEGPVNYNIYKNPELAKLMHLQFEKGVDYAYYVSGAKAGVINEHDLSTNLPAQINRIPIQDIKQVTRQPNKNDTHQRKVGIQARMIAYGLIDDNKSYFIKGYGEMNGSQLRELFDKVLAEDIRSQLKELGFLERNYYGNYEINVEALSNFLTEILDDKNYNTENLIKSLALSEDKSEFAIPLNIGQSPGTMLDILNSSIDDVRQMNTGSPAYKNISRVRDLEMKVVNENGVEGLVVEARLPMWPELYKYYRHKARLAKAKTPQEHKEVEKVILQEIKDSGFKMVYYRIPTEYPYSFVRIEIKEFTNVSLGSGIELADEFVSQTGADLDGDAIFGMISMLNFKNDKVELVSPGLDSAGARQSLITAIFDQTIGKSPKDQLISAEDNVLKVRGKNTKLPELKIGTPASNKRAFELNNMNVIGAAAIVNSSSWFLRGTKLTINTKSKLPKLDKDYGTSLSDEIIKDDQTKYTQGNTVVQAGVDMPKEATFTKLGFNEEMVKVLMFMTDVMTVDMDYALDFLQHPIIKKYRSEIEAITDDKKEFSYRQKVWKIEKDIMGTSKNDFIIEEDQDKIITQDEIKKGERGPEVLWKYLELKRQTSNYAKFNITLSKILKPNDANPEKMFTLLSDLKDLPNMYDGMETLLPAIEINTATGKKIFKKQRESSSEWINANYDAILAKLAIADSISYYFTPEFQKVYDMFKTYNNVNFFNEDINEFHDLFYRYVLGRTVNPVASYLHLGMEAPSGSNVSYKENDNYSLNYIRRKIIGLKNELLLQENPDLDKMKQYGEMLYTLSYYVIDDKKGEFKKDGKIQKVGILKMASGIYDDEIVTNILKGFMTMITNEDPEIKKFAKDVRDFSIFTGWSRGNNNVGGYIPRDAWGVDAPSYNSVLRESFRTMDSNKLSLAIMKHNPRKYTRKIWQKFGKDAGGKNIYYFTPLPNTTVVKTGEKNKNGDDLYFNRQIQLNPYYFMDNNIKFGTNGKPIGLPFYFNMKVGSKIGLYRADEFHRVLTLVSFNSFPDVFDIQQDGAMSTDSLYIPERVPMEEGPKIIAPIQEVQPIITENNILPKNIREITNHSGGAIGADSMFDKIGNKEGQNKHIHYYFGNKTSKGNRLLTQEEVNEGIIKMKNAAKILNKNPQKESTINLLARNWFQVKNSTQIIAIAPINEDMTFVEGGTGWAVAMAQTDEIKREINVFNLNDNKWYIWNNNKFILSDIPTLHKNFAGIGSRQNNGIMTAESIQAIQDVYNKTKSKLAIYKTQEELAKMPLLERIEHAKTTLPINAEKVGMSPEVTQEFLDKLSAITTMEEFNAFKEEFKKRCHGNMPK